MTIDECIYYETSIDRTGCERSYTKCEHEQIASWLKELKELKELRSTNAELHDEIQAAIVMQGSLVEESYAKGFNDGCAKFSVGQDYEAGYNKAIDDCKSIVLQTLDNGYLIDTLWLRMEQLKAGGKNENN